MRQTTFRTSRRHGAALALLTMLTTPGLTGARAATAEPRQLSLDEAIARGLEASEGILVERAEAAAAEAAVAGAAGAYDPLLAVDGGWRRVTAPVASAFAGAPAGALAPTDELLQAGASVRQLLPTGGAVAVRAATGRVETDGTFALLSPAYESLVGVELRQPLLRDRAIDPARHALRVRAADRDRAAASLHREVADTVAAIERAYWALAAARREVAVRAEAVTLADEQMAQTASRIEAGAAPETEIAQPRAELERRRGELLEAEERVARADSVLKLLILGDASDLWLRDLAPVDEATAPSAAIDTAAALEAALASRPELAAVEAVVERRLAESALARDAVRPVLDLVVSYDRFGLAGDANPATGGVPGLPATVPPGLEGGLGSSLGGLGDGDFDDARVALVVELPLRNRTARAGVEMARLAERRAAAELAGARNAVRAEVLDAAAALRTAAARVEAARAGREAAEVQLAAERDRYGAGLSTNFLILTRQNDLSRARMDEIDATTAWLAARTEMARASGTLLAERGIALDLAIPR